MFRKIVIYLSIFALLFCCCTVPVFADPVNTDYVDLFTSDNYNINIGGTWSIYDTLNFSGNSTTVFCKWSVPIYDNNAKYYLYFESSLEPTLMKAGANSTTYNNLVDCSKVGQNGNLYLYTWSGECTGDMFLRFAFNGKFNVSVKALWMSSANSYSCNLMNFSFTQVSNDASGIYCTNHVVGLQNLPFALNFDQTYDENTQIVFQGEAMLSTFSFNVLEEISFFVKASSMSNISCRVYNNTVGNGIPVPITYSVYNTPQIYNPPQSQGDTGETPFNYFCVRVDLSDVDLSQPNTVIQLSFVAQAITYRHSYEAAYIEIISCTYTPKLGDPLPWYKTFWNWLSAPLNNIIELLRGDQADPDNVVEDNAAEMATQASVMDELNEQLQMVERPTVDSEELVQDNIVIEPVAMNVMTSIINEDILVPVLIVICTLALLGYILFGSKGA